MANIRRKSQHNFLAGSAARAQAGGIFRASDAIDFPESG
jgi:hypothetical protein